MNEQFTRIHDAAQAVRNDAFVEAHDGIAVFLDELGRITAALDAPIHDAGVADVDKKLLRDLADRLRALLRRAERIESVPRSAGLLGALSKDVHDYAHFFGEMALLEQKMQAVAESGQELLARLTHAGEDGNAREPAGARRTD